jgi:hypothetical protein
MTFLSYEDEAGRFLPELSPAQSEQLRLTGTDASTWLRDRIAYPLICPLMENLTGLWQTLADLVGA